MLLGCITKIIMTFFQIKCVPSINKCNILELSIWFFLNDQIFQKLRCIVLSRIYDIVLINHCDEARFTYSCFLRNLVLGWVLQFNIF